MTRPLFITLEGGEGSGKSTQAKAIAKFFEARAVPHVLTREPGGSENAEKIRSLLVTKDGEGLDFVAELLLFFAARREHVEKTVKPALNAGKVVICDRFTDSTMVYQGAGRGLAASYVKSLHNFTLGNFWPDITFILDIEPARGLARARDRSENKDESRFEDIPLEFHEKVRAGFLKIAENEPGRCIVIDASRSAEEVSEEILSSLLSLVSSYKL